MADRTTEESIVATVLDYYEGWFDGDANRMERALHPELAKRSLDGDATVETLTAREMIDATARGAGTKYDGDQRRYDVSDDDAYDTIANVTVRGPVYREYVQLVRTEDGWKIVNVLWQRT